MLDPFICTICKLIYVFFTQMGVESRITFFATLFKYIYKSINDTLNQYTEVEFTNSFGYHISENINNSTTAAFADDIWHYLPIQKYNMKHICI